MSLDVKYLIIDCDGTLTDGNYYVSSNGVVTKSFNTRDFYAINRIQSLGVQVIIVTSANDGAVDAKANTNDIYCFSNVKDKEKTIERTIEGNSWSEVAYIGDAENDLACMKKAGFSACPADAIDEVRATADYVACRNGGNCAVWEVIKHLVSKMGHDWLT